MEEGRCPLMRVLLLLLQLLVGAIGTRTVAVVGGTRWGTGH